VPTRYVAIFGLATSHCWKCFDAFLKALSNRFDHLANYFVARLNRGLVESLNTKVKTIFRRGDGIRNVVHIFQRLDLDIEGYRRLA